MNKPKVYIIGAGTLGKLVCEIVESDAKYEVGGFYDDNYPQLSTVLGYPVLGTISTIPQQTSLALVLGIGEPKYRKRLLEREAEKGHVFPSFIHASTILSKYCKIEDGVTIGPNSSVLTGSTVKKGSCLLSHVNINQDILINEFCLIGAGVVVGNGAVLGEGCHVTMAQKVLLNQEIPAWTYYNNTAQ